MRPLLQHRWCGSVSCSSAMMRCVRITACALLAKSSKGGGPRGGGGKGEKNATRLFKGLIHGRCRFRSSRHTRGLAATDAHQRWNWRGRRQPAPPSRIRQIKGLGGGLRTNWPPGPRNREGAKDAVVFDVPSWVRFMLVAQGAGGKALPLAPITHAAAQVDGQEPWAHVHAVRSGTRPGGLASGTTGFQQRRFARAVGPRTATPLASVGWSGRKSRARRAFSSS